MATVRIYKVAELLNTSSQEVMALLKRDHGIEVKSASSTIEEVVAREFVSRLSRQRNLNVPSNASPDRSESTSDPHGRTRSGGPLRVSRLSDGWRFGGPLRLAREHD